MKNFLDSLNRIFKAPLFMICLFLSFLFLGGINSQKVSAAEDFEITGHSSNFSVSGTTLTTSGQDSTSYWVEIYHTTSGGELKCISLMLNAISGYGTIVDAVGKSYTQCLGDSKVAKDGFNDYRFGINGNDYNSNPTYLDDLDIVSAANVRVLINFEQNNVYSFINALADYVSAANN